jgi:nucleotide-binding universal stress UspA family protein
MATKTLPEQLRDALVVAVDDSAPAREALRYAASMAKESGRALHVVSVWNFVRGPAPVQDPDAGPTEAAWQAEAERRLRDLVDEELGAEPALDVHPLALHGNTVPVLLAVSELARHLVVGSRGRGGFSGLLLGSTSEQLMHYAHSPVTVVRQGCTIA